MADQERPVDFEAFAFVIVGALCVGSYCLFQIFDIAGVPTALNFVLLFALAIGGFLTWVRRENAAIAKKEAARREEAEKKAANKEGEQKEEPKKEK